MCFKSKVKTPKTNPEALKAPEPVLLEEPKGVDFAADESEGTTENGTDGLKIDKAPVKDKGDGASTATAKDTGASKVVTGSAMKRATKKLTQ